VSILDYEHDELSPVIWDKQHQMRSGIKSFIYNSLEMFFMRENIKGDTHFVKDIIIASSLATYYFQENSDMDVKIIIDMDEFKENNPNYNKYTNDDVLDRLIDDGRESSWLTAAIPGTAHVLDVYFIEIDEFTEDKYIKYDSLYSITKNKWIKIPQKINTEGNPSYILDRAKEKAKDYLDQLSLDISQAKRSTLDWYVLMDYLKSIDSDEKEEFYGEMKKVLNEINESVEKLIQDREMVKLLRKETFNKKDLDSQFEQLMGSFNYADGNLIFKIVQRYGYMRILTDLAKLFDNKKIKVDKIDTVNNILSSI